MYFKKYAAIVFIFALLIHVNSNAQPVEIQNVAELQVALQKLNVLGSVLYIGAHPDDENTAVLAYFSKGRKYRTAYLSFTRGDGGQNLIGSEKGTEIGIIRTQELLQARKFDGAEQFFTRAIDFGYSKSPEETFDFWGKEQILADVVWTIRKFRPDVIITRFPPDGYGGHGHHTASAVLAKEAFHAAANPDKFPEQLKYVQPWQTKRIYWNKWRPSPEEAKGLRRVNIGEYNPLLGKSYSEIAAESRSMHKSQGFGATGRRGTRYDYFELVNGEPAATDIFEGIDTTWNRVPGGHKVGEMLNEVLLSFEPQNPSKSITKLLAVYKELKKLDENYWVKIKQQELMRVVQSCAALWIEAIADDFAAAPGDEIHIRTTLVNRSNHPFKLEKMRIAKITLDSTLNIAMKNNDPLTIDKTVRIPEDYAISQPYWLKHAPQKGMFSILDQNLIGLAENPPAIRVIITLSSEGNLLEYAIPVLFRWTDRVDGELYRPFEIRPKITINLEDKICIFADNNPKEVKVKVKSHARHVAGEIRLKGSAKWSVTPVQISFSLKNKYEEKQVTFKVSPPEQSEEAVFVAEATINGKKFNQALIEISHPHIKKQVLFPESQIKLVKLDIKRVAQRLGYIMGAGDEVADDLRNLGYDVILLNDEMLENSELSQFDAIITGIRAYNTRTRIKYIQPKLLQYVKNGGTLIVQYNISRGLQTEEIGPYPFKIGRDRVCVETAPISFLNPAHPLLNFPNKITQKDFEGWVQERGLYFATQ
ncbi:MAG: PIG-L family deacetylase, partial [bacterium]